MISYGICLPLKSEPQKSTYICINANNTCNACFMRVFLNRPALKTVTENKSPQKLHMAKKY